MTVESVRALSEPSPTTRPAMANHLMEQHGQSYQNTEGLDMAACNEMHDQLHAVPQQSSHTHSGPVTENSERAVDNSTWDGNRAMGACSSASDYRSICAGEKNVGQPDERQHWALPHHYLGKGPNASGVRNALSRLPQTQGLTNKTAAQSHLEAHMSQINPQASRLPREALERGIGPGLGGYEIRDVESGPPVMSGHFAVFDEWTHIDSIFEGEFMERIAPGAFAKTFAENRPHIRVTFNHGKDHSLGDQILGPITTLEEDARGAYYEVPLFDGIPPLIMSGLRANAYGASFRFRVTREDVAKRPERSPYNPDGIPERTIREAEVSEFGPVTFPAYAGASAAVRSLTDEFIFGRFVEDPERLRELVEFMHQQVPNAPSIADAGQRATSAQERRVAVPVRKQRDYLKRGEPQWKL